MKYLPLVLFWYQDAGQIRIGLNIGLMQHQIQVLLWYLKPPTTLDSLRLGPQKSARIVIPLISSASFGFPSSARRFSSFQIPIL